MDRNEINARLQKLRHDIPSMLADAEDEDDFWPAFAGEADLIENGAASAEDCRYVRNQLNRMLQQAGVAERLYGYYSYGIEGFASAAYCSGDSPPRE